ncbi:MAG: cbb3-type cytochrome c oxidase subunit I, partial [Deltaproteobacteria bacterium]
MAAPARSGVDVPEEAIPKYNDTIVKKFCVMAVVWGIVGMLVGVIAAAQLAFPALNFDVPFLTFGRIRPLHTNAVIF